MSDQQYSLDNHHNQQRPGRRRCDTAAVERTELTRPKHLPDEQWAAIDACRERLTGALEDEDRPAVLGAAKELVESVARSVLHITGTTLASGADYGQVVSSAHKSLNMHPGSITNPDVRAIAQSAQTIATTLGTVRNAAGTGHGRALVPAIDDPSLQVSVDAALLWSRWALGVLGPLLEGVASTVIQAVQAATRQVTLSDLFEKTKVAEQAEQDQRAIGVAFGQRAAGGFGNAWVVGVRPVVDDPQLRNWPAAYRLGLIEGMVIDILGDIQLRSTMIEAIVAIAEPVGLGQLTTAMDELAGKVRQSVWSTTCNADAVKDAPATIAALENALKTSAKSAAFTDLIEALKEPLAAAPRGVSTGPSTNGTVDRRGR